MSSNNSRKLMHEDFSIQPTGHRSTILRPMRTPFEGDECYVSIDDRMYPVSNLSAFGLAITTSSTLIPFIEAFDAQLIYRNHLAAKIHLKYVHIRKVEDEIHEMGYEIIGEPVRMENIFAIRSSHDVLNDLADIKMRRTSVPDLFRLTILDMEDALLNLESQLNIIEKRQKEDFPAQWNEFSQTFSTVLANHFLHAFQPFYDKLSEILKDQNETVVRESFTYFREKVGKFLYSAPYAGRGYYKPRGYAGDFEMMNQIYENTKAGETLFAQCIHKYFVEVPAAKAVRNRASYLKEKITRTVEKFKNRGQLPKILALAAGPAREVQSFIEEAPDSNPAMSMYFIDQDKGALLHGQRKLREIQARKKTQHSLVFLHMAIKDILENGLPEGDFDLIYSAGLFDYLSDPVAKFAVLKLYEALAPNGQLIIGNFSLSNPNQFGMEIALDWPLIYRSKEDMKKIFSLIGKEVEVEEEQLGINLFAIATK